MIGRDLVHDNLTHCHSGVGSCSRSRNSRGETCGSPWFGHGECNAQLAAMAAILIVVIADAWLASDRSGSITFNSQISRIKIAFRCSENLKADTSQMVKTVQRLVNIA